MSITPIDRVHVLSLWREVEPLVIRALDHSEGEFDQYDILQLLCAGSMQLWMTDNMDGMAVTQPVIYPRLKALQVVLVAGHDYETWFPKMMEVLEEWAKRAGFVRIQEFGRPGWERVSEKFHLGFRKSYISMIKDI